MAETLTRLLVTGGAGFIGSSFVRNYLAAHPEACLLNFDALTYAGNLENLKSVESLPNYRFRQGDITSETNVEAAFAEVAEIFGGPVDAVIHFAAETHVDRSIQTPEITLRTNVMGTGQMLQTARKQGVKRFVHISTDEVYGTLGETGAFTEESPIQPNSPYSAGKAGSDMIARSYFETFGLPVLITRCSNNYGPYQFPEKLIPLMIANALEDRPLPVYGDGLNVRDWIHVDDHNRAVEAVLHRGKPGEVYNIGGRSERTNLHVVRTLLSLLNKPESLITYVKDRPGHDRRYAIDCTKIEQELGWTPTHTFEEGLAQTVQWYLDNPEWVARVRSGAYQEYYKKMYEGR